MVIVHFWAEWDGYDITMNRHLEATRGRFSGRAAFFSCNIDREENWELCYGLRIPNMPWVVVFAGGMPQERICGNRTPDTLAAEIGASLTAEGPVS